MWYGEEKRRKENMAGGVAQEGEEAVKTGGFAEVWFPRTDCAH